MLKIFFSLLIFEGAGGPGPTSFIPGVGVYQEDV